MIPWIVLDTAPIPGDSGQLRLLQRGTEFSIQLGHNELMNSRLSGSEEALATLACARVGARAGARFLIGGFGMGFTLRAALDGLAADARIVLAELVPAVLTWGRGPLAAIAGDPLGDPRVEAREADVVGAIRAASGAFDAILLDVDNGPKGMTRRSNDRLYDVWGLKRAHYALRPGGILAVWSGSPDRRFKARLKRCGFAMEEIRFPAHPGGRRHVLWIGVRAEAAAATA